MTQETPVPATSSAPNVPAPPPDEENPALIDAHKTFVITVISAALFIGAVFVFVL